MFCYQCEQTARGEGCTVRGVCGKDPDTAAMQDLLVYALKGLSMYAHRARQLGVKDHEADVFVLASVILERSGKRDVIPNVLAEAMAMQLPVVATDISGIGELVRDGESGRLVAANDASALASVLEELRGDEAQRRRLGLGGAQKVARDFDREVNIQDLARLFLADAETPAAPMERVRASLP